MKDIVKTFGEVVASNHVNFEVKKGEIHALLGENGAGKSTIMSMLSGIYRADSGDIYINGKLSRIRSPKESMELGIGMVHQNFRLVDTLTAVENIILGEKSNKWRGSSWMKKKIEEIEELADKYGLTFPTKVPIWQLSVGEQQRVEIVKTLYRGAEIIIFDEPTSVLTPGEVEQLFLTMQELKRNGKTMIITTHKLKEVMTIADQISVMRKGTMIAQMSKEEATIQSLANLMVGQNMADEGFSIKVIEKGKPILDVQNLVVRTKLRINAIDRINFSVHEYEIVGVAGVAGNGQKELAEVLTGLMQLYSGQIVFNNEKLTAPSVQQLIDKGIAHIPENRMKSGLAGSLGIIDNLMMKTYRSNARAKFGLMKKKENMEWAANLIKKFDVRTPDMVSPVAQLSGGNQQKLLFAREIDINPKLMIAVHPTQGLDVGAAKAVHEMLVQLRDSGSGVLLISEDLEEVMQLSDKILVLYNGKINGVIDRGQANREVIGQLMAGLNYKEGAFYEPEIVV
ncbi:ABC transporter ATP-binding protein [Lysinibacillus telephonicus]|uniref:ABC transporter ATP-binding protein n=2 Tax=Lysinibacillus telephonicus TaxID=1714840 RepID=A0A3S0HVW3_9BACI|nr:ABC transporter ATP-binding protein [Lysinibacillus telephonicus]RTQ88860.1 ABC transporter ATP-binding protein [Lysinibacillus telephonicus]